MRRYVFLILTILVTYLGFSTTVVGDITPGSPAETAGVMTGDRIVAVDGSEVVTWNDLGPLVQKSEGSEIDLTVERKGETLDLKLTPVYEEEGSRYVIGTYCKVSHDPLRGIQSGFIGTWRLFGVMYDSLKMLITGGASIEEVSGPVGIVQMVGETSSQGIWSYGFLMALICVNLAVINMLPLPALDGGRILVVLFSWVTGKSVSPRVEGIIHAVGMVALLALAAVVTFNDIGKLIG